MTLTGGMVLLSSVLGLLVLVLTFIVFKVKRQKDEDDKAMDDEAFNRQIGLVNEKVLELDDYHNFVKDEIEKKHKELLFLYQMISEKEKVIRQIQLDIETLKSESTVDENNAIKEMPKSGTDISATPRSKKIIDLKRQGYEAKEIAKILGIGVGEVSLILNLYD